MDASEEQFLSLEDVATRLQVSDQTIRRWIKSGKLTAYKPGLEYRIRESDLEEFLAARAFRPKAVAQPRARAAAEGRLAMGRTWEELAASLTEEQLIEILAGILDARITFDEAAARVEKLAGVRHS